MTTYNYATVGGRKMFYREAGKEDAPTIVLLHGFPSSSHMFRDLIPKLSDRLHVISPDYIGFGYSDAPNAREFEYTFDNLAEHVEELLHGRDERGARNLWRGAEADLRRAFQR